MGKDGFKDLPLQGDRVTCIQRILCKFKALGYSGVKR
jgi:hypothetical protein